MPVLNNTPNVSYHIDLWPVAVLNLTGCSVHQILSRKSIELNAKSIFLVFFWTSFRWLNISWSVFHRGNRSGNSNATEEDVQTSFWDLRTSCTHKEETVKKERSEKKINLKIYSPMRFRSSFVRFSENMNSPKTNKKEISNFLCTFG